MTFLEAADRIGARLCRDAFWDGDRCNWIGETRVGENSLEWVALGPDLYGGAAGIALFLHHLAGATGEAVFRETAKAAIAFAIAEADRIEADQRAGFYLGWGGIAAAAARLGRTEDAHRLACAMEPIYEADVLYGSAGAIVALLDLGHIERAVQHGDALIASAEPGEEDVSWRTLIGCGSEPQQNLTGFSHGTAGIGWALLELFAATGEARFRDTAEAAFRYERACFSAEEGNWPDYRDGAVDYATAWCHGAPGIGFSRIRASQILDSASYREEVAVALATTEAELARRLDGDFSLCHGVTGNADLLLFAGTESTVPASLMAAAIDRYEVNRKLWPCGLAGSAEIPGLMLGVAGIGYFCLRLTDPQRYPTILLPRPGGG